MDGEDSIDGIDSIDGSESSLRPGRGRGSTSPLSILLLTSSALSEASCARAAITFPTSLSALRMASFILRSASRCRRSCSRTLMLPPVRSPGGLKVVSPPCHKDVLRRLRWRTTATHRPTLSKDLHQRDALRWCSFFLALSQSWSHAYLRRAGKPTWLPLPTAHRGVFWSSAVWVEFVAWAASCQARLRQS